MTQKVVLENKISSIQKYLAVLGRYKTLTRKEIVDNLDTRGATERYLYLVVQSAIDLSAAVISYKKFRKPTTFSEGFTILMENGLISKELEDSLVKMTGFRNILAHGYENVDYDVMYDVLQNRLEDIKSFAFQMEKVE